MSLFDPKQLRQPISFTGSLFGTSSWSQYATTASYALNASAGGFIDTSSFAITGSNVFKASQTISGSLIINDSINSSIFLIKSGTVNLFNVANTGQTTINSNAADVLLIKNFVGNSILTVSQSGILILATQSAELTTLAPIGGMYFTSASFYVGLE